LVYDITRKETFENITKWLEEIKSYANENTLLVLVGNKTDIPERFSLIFSNTI
jgi:Ras-related protein Rab-2A